MPTSSDNSSKSDRHAKRRARRQAQTAAEQQAHAKRKVEIQQDLRQIVAAERAPLPAQHSFENDSFGEVEATPSFRLLAPSLRLWRANLEAAITIVILPSMASFLASTLLQPPLKDLAYNRPVYWSWTATAGLILLGVAMLWSLINLPVNYYFQIQAVRGQQPAIRDCYRHGLSSFWRVFVLNVCMLGLTAGGLLLFIIPGFIALRRYFLAPYFLLDRDLTIRQALRTSAAESKAWAGYIWGLLLTFLFMTFVGSIIQATFDSFGGVAAAVGGIAGSLVAFTYMFAPALRYREMSGEPVSPEPAE